jgi:hypothetical protein
LGLNVLAHASATHEVTLATLEITDALSAMRQFGTTRPQDAVAQVSS